MGKLESGGEGDIQELRSFGLLSGPFQGQPSWKEQTSFEQSALRRELVWASDGRPGGGLEADRPVLSEMLILDYRNYF